MGRSEQALLPNRFCNEMETRPSEGSEGNLQVTTGPFGGQHSRFCRNTAASKDRKRRGISPAAGEEHSTEFTKRHRHPQDLSSSLEALDSANESHAVHAAAPHVLPIEASSHLRTPIDNKQQLWPFEDSSEHDTITDHELIECIAAILENICAINNSRVTIPGNNENPRNHYRSESYPDGTSSIFFSLQRPAVDMRYYVARLVRYMRVSKSVFVVALIYLDRIHAADEILALTDFNVHRLITTAVSVACKFLEDEVHRNSTICRIGGVPSVAEMNMLESQFLRRIKWDCSVSIQSYDLYRTNVFKRHYGQPTLSEVSSSLCSVSDDQTDNLRFDDSSGDAESFATDNSAVVE
jgi:hypothetical protein